MTGFPFDVRSSLALNVREQDQIPGAAATPILKADGRPMSMESAPGVQPEVERFEAGVGQLEEVGRLRVVLTGAPTAASDAWVARRPRSCDVTRVSPYDAAALLRVRSCDALVLSPGWDEGPGAEDLRAVVALASLSVPVFWSGPGVPASLAQVVEPLPPAPLLEPDDRLAARALEACHRRIWLNSLGGPSPRARCYGHLAPVDVSPRCGLLPHSSFQHRVIEEMRFARDEDRPVSAIVIEARWASGAPVSLPRQQVDGLDAALRRRLRDTDIVSKLEDGVYIAFLPGQPVHEALTPAGRLLGIDCGHSAPFGDAPIHLAIGVSGRPSYPTDGLTFVAEAELAMRAVTDPRVGVRVYGPELAETWGAPSLGPAQSMLRPESRLVDLLPGLYRTPFSDRQFEAHLRALGALVPSFDLARGRRLAGPADTLLTLLGVADLDLRRILWRSCLLRGLGAALAPASTGPRDAGTWSAEVAAFKGVLEACGGLQQEAQVVIDAHRHLFRSQAPRRRQPDDLHTLSRVLEVVDAWLTLVESPRLSSDPAPTFSDIRDSLSQGAVWRYDRKVVMTFLDWLEAQPAGQP